MSARVVFVTGSSTGIGEATALHFARLGDTVYATMRTPDRSGDTLRAASQLEGLDLTLVALTKPREAFCDARHQEAAVSRSAKSFRTSSTSLSPRPLRITTRTPSVS